MNQKELLWEVLQGYARAYCGEDASQAIRDGFARELIRKTKPLGKEWLNKFAEPYLPLADHPGGIQGAIVESIKELKESGLYGASSVKQVHDMCGFEELAATAHATNGRMTFGLGKGAKLLKGAGVVAGVGLVGHGLYNAAHAANIDQETGEKRRNWTQTVAGIGEAAGGAALSWGSYVAGKNSTPLTR